MLGHLLSELDKDDDGVVTLADVESASIKWCDRVLWWSRQVRACTNHPVVQLGVGWTLLSYGGHFKQVAVTYASLESTHFSLVASQFSRLRETYATMRSGLRLRSRRPVAARGGQDGDAGALVIARKLPGGAFEVPFAELVAAVGDPRPLIEVVVRIHGAAVACLCAVLNDNAARLGIGVHLGQRLAAVASPVLVRLILGPEDAVDEVTAPVPDVAVQEFQASDRQIQVPHDSRAVPTTHVIAPRADPTRLWMEVGLEGLCTALGVALAYWLRGLASLWTACGLGGRVSTEALCEVCDVTPSGGAAFFGTILGGLSFAFHLRHGGRPAIPSWLQLPLAGPRLLEFGLTALTEHSAMTSPP